MAGGLTLPALYSQDQLYAAYCDRLLIKSLGIQAGVVEENDFKVTAGSGLQVEVEKGKGFVAQTGAKQESSNTFYNGLYNVLSPTKQNPYNSVTVYTANPQIAQIILRVYDVEELGSTGSSFARIEWLNGTENAGATKAHIEESKASEFGAAALPTSSLRLCYVVVPKNATVSSEYSIVDERKSSLEITSREIAAESVLTAAIKALNVTAAKLAEGAVTAAKLGAEAVTATKLAEGAVTTAKLAEGAVTTAKFASEVVTGPKLGLGTVRQETGTTQSFLSWGKVSEAGTVEGGTGDFSCSLTSTGIYSITWTSEKSSSAYAVIAMSQNRETTFRTEPLKAGFNLRCYNSIAESQSTAFQFIVCASS